MTNLQVILRTAQASQKTTLFKHKHAIFLYQKPFLRDKSLDLAKRTHIMHTGLKEHFQYISLTNPTMTKQDLVAGAAESAGVTKKAAGAVLDAVLGMITKSLKKGENVTVTGFGTFRVSKRAARTGVNPRNPREKIKIPAMKLPAFKAGKSLKDAVR